MKAYINKDKEIVYEKIDKYRGYEYVIGFYTYYGYRCGYIKLNNTHPLYAKSYFDINLDTIEISYNGGLYKLPGYYIGWDHFHNYEGIDEASIRKYIKDPNKAQQYIEEAYKSKDNIRGWYATLDDVEKECFQVIDEIIKTYKN